MSQVHALSDDQVSQELKKMTAFIRMEAQEKAREIELKANEEFEMEKTRLVREETDALDDVYAKKFKQAEMSQQITRSTMANKTRLRVLGARQVLLDDIFAAAEKKLGDAAKDKTRYQATLNGLLLEGFYAMNEPTLTIRARKADFDLVEKAIGAAAEEYKKNVGKETKATVDKENPLPASITGGILVLGGNGKIAIDNTFEARLELLKENALPAMREALFGKNPNRKFYD